MSESGVEKINTEPGSDLAATSSGSHPRAGPRDNEPATARQDVPPTLATVRGSGFNFTMNCRLRENLRRWHAWAIIGDISRNINCQWEYWLVTSRCVNAMNHVCVTSIRFQW